MFLNNEKRQLSLWKSLCLEISEKISFQFITELILFLYSNQFAIEKKWTTAWLLGNQIWYVNVPLIN